MAALRDTKFYMTRKTDKRYCSQQSRASWDSGISEERKNEHMSVLEVKNLCVQYHTDEGMRSAVSGFSLSIAEGETAGLVGESGCGKSTAVRSIMGMSAENALVSCDALTLEGEKPVPGQNIAMIFQDSQNCLNPSVKIGRQITETVKNRRKCSRKEAKQRALELLDLVGIRNPGLRMKQYPFELSGGMRQRVVIAVVLACDPRLIIADEPTTALDAAVQAQILALLRRISRDTGTALLLVSHDMGVVASLCKRVYVMRKGQIVESGSSEDIFYSPEQEYTKRLIAQAGRKRFLPQKSKGETLFRLEHLTKEYNTREGIRDISLELCRGEIFALAGESGSGKTTLARVLCGLLTADSGRVENLGRGNGNVQMVFQDPYGALNPCLSAGQALDEALRKTVPDAALRQERAEGILRLTGLKDKVLNSYPRDLSGGERQRVGIARALVCEPELLICDEAFSSLDASARDRLLNLLLELQKEKSLTCLFISHDIKTVAQISGRMGVLYQGELVETGKTKAVCTDPWHPYTKQLLTSVPEPHPLRSARKKPVLMREDAAKDGSSAQGGCPFARSCSYAMECCRREKPESYVFGERTVKCFLYSERHSGRRAGDYTMTSQI